MCVNRLPGLRPALGVVEHLGLGREVVEVVPDIFQRADAGPVLQAQGNPVHVIPRAAEQRGEIALQVPVPQLFAVEQHHARRKGAAPALVAGLGATQDRLAAHVTRQQIPDIADREHIRVDHQRATAIVHKLRRRKAQRRERLEIVVDPGTPFAGAAIQLPFPALETGEFSGVHRPDGKLFVVTGVAAQRIFRHHGTQRLPVIALDENAMVHCGAASPMTPSQGGMVAVWASPDIVRRGPRPGIGGRPWVAKTRKDVLEGRLLGKSKRWRDAGAVYFLFYHHK